MNPPAQDDSPYRDVRALGRGLALMEALAIAGWSRPAELAVRCGLERSTVYRLLQNLARLGYVSRRDDGSFALTTKVRGLIAGVRQDEVFLEQAKVHLVALTEEIQWPSDLALLKQGVVTIEESTHQLSPITFHRATVRQERSLFASALGRAILMQLSLREIDVMREIATTAEGTGEDPVPSLEVIGALAEHYRKLGFASAAGAFDPNVSAIALGFRGHGQIIGSVNVVFFRRVLSPNAAAARFLPALQRCVSRIVESFDQEPGS